MKAVFLYNFGSFVTWPDSAFRDPESPMRYCTNATGIDVEALRAALHDERIGDRSIDFQSVRTDDDHRSCHILYITGLDAKRTQAVLQRLGSAPVLTVSDGKRWRSTG